MFFCVHLEERPQGLLQTSVKRVIIFVLQHCLTNEALHHVGIKKSKKDKIMVMYQILNIVRMRLLVYTVYEALQKWMTKYNMAVPRRLFIPALQ
jgi:hypothetical protein